MTSGRRSGSHAPFASFAGWIGVRSWTTARQSDPIKLDSRPTRGQSLPYIFAPLVQALYPVGLAPKESDALNVLLVEDNTTYASLISALLGEGGSGRIRAVPTPTLRGAVEALGRERFDAVVLDLLLPDSHGLSSLEGIVAANPDVPVIVLTGTDDDKTAVAAVRAGAQDYLTKDGLSAESLRRALDYAIVRKDMVRALSSGGAFLEGLVNAVPSGLAALEAQRDPSGAVRDFRCLLANPAFNSLLGHSAESLLEQGMARMATAIEWPDLIATLAGVVAKREAIDVEHRILQPDGQRLWLRMTATPLGDGVAMAVSDITERLDQQNRVTKALEAAEAADAAKTQVLQAISHDLRTPLNSIIGFAEVMQCEVFGVLENPHYKSYVDDIARSGHGMLEIINDLLDLRRLQEIAHADKTYRHLIDLAPDLICVVRENIIELMNDAGAAMLGVWPADTMIGRDIRQYVHEDSRALLDHADAKLIGESRRVPARLLDTRGRVIHVELAAIPHDPDGAGTSFMLVARDVSERQRATEEIVQREERLSKIMDTMVEALVIIDTDGTIETFNVAAEQMFEYEAAEVLGQPVSILMVEQDAANHQDHVERYLNTGQKRILGMGREVQARRRDGTTFPVDLAISEMNVGGRKLFIGMLRDITERKIAEQRLLFLATRNP